MKTPIAVFTLLLTTAAHADLSPICSGELKNEGLATTVPASTGEIEGVKLQLAKKLKIAPKRLRAEGSATFGDGAAGFAVMSFERVSKTGQFEGFYSVTAYDGSELTSYTLITD